MNIRANASIIAPRRSAARSARLEGSALGDAGLDALAGATFSPGRPTAAFAPPRPLADFDLGPGRVSDMREYMTDRSVIVNWTRGRRLSHRRYSEWNIGRDAKELTGLAFGEPMAGTTHRVARSHSTNCLGFN